MKPAPAPQAEAVQAQALEVLRELLAAKAEYTSSFGGLRTNDVEIKGAELRLNAAWDRARTLASASDAAKQHPLQPVSDLTAAELDADEDRKLLEQALGALGDLWELADECLADEAIAIATPVIAALRVRLGKESGNG
jgi:hypothetical protein